MVDLGINSHHQDLLLSYLKFARYLRIQTLKTVEYAFQTIEREIYDDTYTQDEVKALFNKLQKVILCDVESEVCSFGHYNVVMLQQLFQQSEKWHLRLNIELSDLQNVELLEHVRQLEVDESLAKPAKEVEIDEQGSVALLRLEIEKLKNDNLKLEKEQRTIADKLERKTEELQTVQKNLSDALSQIRDFRQNLGSDEEKEQLEEKLKNFEHLLEVDGEASKKRQIELENELLTTRNQIAQVQAQLKLAEEELERKFSETKAYATMKQILHCKNEQIKKLREKLNEDE